MRHWVSVQFGERRLTELHLNFARTSPFVEFGRCVGIGRCRQDTLKARFNYFAIRYKQIIASSRVPYNIIIPYHIIINSI